MRTVLFLTIALYGSATTAQERVFTGITRLSCEALLCLSSGVRPSPCHPALSHYFSISKSTWPATFAARLAFLKICPTGNVSLAKVIANGAGRCDGAMAIKHLNAVSQFIGLAENERLVPNHYRRLIPMHCRSYYTHPLTSDLPSPVPKKDCTQSPVAYPFGVKPYQSNPDPLQARCRLIWVWE